ncbi:hypothetical protein SmJEL517_g02351 [Synchytrium microbalum]|uniref:Uncharacterized protein n=1 Tax=Synchytrium microbalum TaxID=1806994 RepID=A0A507C2D4_9FUNG|nr:uncharacterized protein SmJEL517_g02351 [Synchytrium microbalum]TPX35287.1 hypothetical protein SmJEL517_g02351 [Synchytrium microbalum]
MPLAHQLRDRIARALTIHVEPKRQALRAIVRDATLPMGTRFRAQLDLNKLPRYTRPSNIHGRCPESGTSRGLVVEHKLSRILFRERALGGEIPGSRSGLQDNMNLLASAPSDITASEEKDHRMLQLLLPDNI